jgi:hypothetical protein
MTYTFDPLVPRPIDRPTEVAVGPLTPERSAALDDAKVFSGPADPADRPGWRETLRAWHSDARERHGYTGAAYPVIGLDDRNQWDYYREVPGLDRLVETLHEAGLHVFVDYNPWDVGTRRSADDLTELAAVVAELGADGVFLDTLKKAEPELVARLEAARPGIVLEGESKLPVERIEDHSSSWAQFFADSPLPGVLRAHWYERRHMQHHVRRWHRDHSEELQSAWLNGVGVMVWEVVFGVWVGWSRRDSATVRRMVTVQRAAGDLLLEGEWTPLAELAPEAEAAGVYASRWELGGVSLWTLVNRGELDYTGAVLPLDAPERAIGRLVALTGAVVPGRGIAALLHVGADVAEPEWLPGLLTALVDLPHDADARFPHRLARRIGPPDVTRVTSASDGPGRVVLSPGPYVLTVRYRARETGMYQGAPYVDEWKPLPPRLHDARTLQRDGVLATPVAVAASEVTSAEFAEFLDATDYAPAEPHRFLAHWSDGRPVPGTEDQPVTFVDLDDARAYCAWRGGRLPTEDEWQLAGEARPDAFGPGRGGPAVWSWTESEHSDGRTRFVMLKGGSDYRAEGSEWYVEGGRHAPDYSVKLLLPGLGLARSATVGFRCAWDLPAPAVDGEATA